MTIVRGHFAWHELSTTDTSAAQAFYPTVTPWSVQAMEEMPEYSLWMNGDDPIAGVIGLASDPVPGDAAHWVPYVHVYDVDDTVRHVKSLGGDVHKPPKELPSVGCWAVLRDTEGAEIGIYEAADNSPPVYATPKLGEFSWHELAASNFDHAFKFYHALFGWEITSEHDMGHMGVYRLFGLKGVAFGGMYGKEPDAGPPMWLSYIRVADVRAAATQIPTAGGTVVRGPHEVPGGDWIIQCRDGQGATFALQSS